ncbi:hypothetical protein [Streptomyces europaeiscabiei]|uniref:hypothetical protein n=1 Tax=Streptomyces europaeiscabiei TaxID=146819 RepID=UPI0029CA5655|nr:hypothetical protein [Streptomyces europaeiscabiei]
MPQLMRATELTRSQVRSGLAMLRDVIARKGWPPLIYTRADGCHFTADGDVLQAAVIMYAPPQPPTQPWGWPTSRSAAD